MADTARLFMLVAVATAALAGRSDGAWCVCRSDLADSALQKTLDYACGGGADCKPILQSGACFAPDTVKAHCSYAAAACCCWGVLFLSPFLFSSSGSGRQERTL
ncbi:PLASMODESMATA CALLOSE-BINDING PROTEIN 2 [Zea mays]|uniref:PLASMODESMATA CALLOSE-BINDING PROTEIN 2 n=1 Tax=Zea mays TaxID=4577 RepID=A0A1D6L560_MAIZE|nr:PLASMODESMATA CALLOSE-BINDING PROTEIN 2 [Zea mays]